MSKILLLAFPLLLSAMSQPTYSAERYAKWVLDVERALESPKYCQELPLLVEAPEADLEISVVLREILKERCANGNL